MREKPTVCLGFRGVALRSPMCLYIACCLTIPDLLRVSIVYDVDAIVRRCYEASPLLVYRLSSEIQSLILGLPQLALALIGGFVFRWIRITIGRA